jgi:hypothetical protein
MAYRATVASDPIDVPYITTVRAEEHQEIAGRCVTIDLGEEICYLLSTKIQLRKNLVFFATQTARRRK